MTAVSARRSLDYAAERRLVRMGYDIHDGPLQDVAALTSDTRLFRAQLAGLLGEEHRVPVLGWVDDLEARLVALDRALRELVQSLEPRSLMGAPFSEALQAEVDAFLRRTDVKLTLEIDGAFDRLTASQRIALLSVAREALANIREHSRASAVTVSVVEDAGGTRLRIADDGDGFVVDDALARASDRGRLGLVGMRDRIRLLGGTFVLESRPGGPTAVRATVALWEPNGAGGTNREPRESTDGLD